MNSISVVSISRPSCACVSRAANLLPLVGNVIARSWSSSLLYRYLRGMRSPLDSTQRQLVSRFNPRSINICLIVVNGLPPTNFAHLARMENLTLCAPTVIHARSLFIKSVEQISFKYDTKRGITCYIKLSRVVDRQSYRWIEILFSYVFVSV